MGSQSWEVASDICDAHRPILIRPLGPVAEGRDALSRALAQEAEVGLRPCGVKTAHIAVPPVLRIGRIRPAGRIEYATLGLGWPLGGRTPCSVQLCPGWGAPPRRMGFGRALWNSLRRIHSFDRFLAASPPLIPQSRFLGDRRKPLRRIRARILRRRTHRKTRINPPLPVPRLFRVRPPLTLVML